MAEGNAEGMDCVLRLLQAAPDAAAREALWPSMLLGWQEVPESAQAARNELAREHALAAFVQAEWQQQPTTTALSHLSILFGNSAPREAALKVAVDPIQPLAQRLAALQLLESHPHPAQLDILLQQFRHDGALPIGWPL